jgi:hypothetical protein
VPVKIEYELSGQRNAAVLETITPGPFGHEHMADRAQILLWSHVAFNRLPHHVRSLDVGGFSKDGTLQSVADVEEFFILNEFPARGTTAISSGCAMAGTCKTAISRAPTRCAII